MTNERIKNCFQATEAVLILSLGFILPSLIEALLVILNPETEILRCTVLISTIIIDCTALYAGWKLKYDLGVNGCGWNTEMPCPDITKKMTLFSGSYLLYALPVWAATNFICIMANSGLQRVAGFLPWWMFLLSYSPAPVWSIGMLLGHVSVRTLKQDYSPV